MSHRYLDIDRFLNRICLPRHAPAARSRQVCCPLYIYTPSISILQRVRNQILPYTQRHRPSVQHGYGVLQLRWERTSEQWQRIQRPPRHAFALLQPSQQRTSESNQRLQNREHTPLQASRRPRSTDHKLRRAIQPSDVNVRSIPSGSS